MLASQVYEAAAALKAVEEEQAKLEVRARIAGTVRDLKSDMIVGRWINPREAMMRIVASETALIEAYLNDTQIRSVEPGQAVRFYPGVAGIPVVSGEVVSVDETGVKQMSRPLLLAAHGGDIQAATDKHGVVTAKDAMYRVVIRPEQDGLHVTSVSRGTVRIYTDLVVVAENFFFRAMSIFLCGLGMAQPAQAAQADSAVAHDSIRADRLPRGARSARLCSCAADLACKCRGNPGASGSDYVTDGRGGRAGARPA